MSGQDIQKQTLFWHYPEKPLPGLPPKPSEEEVLEEISASNDDCPLNKIICGTENAGNMRKLRRFAFTAMNRNNHSLRGCNFGMYAQSGQGKTFVIKQFSKTLEIPLIFVQSTALNDTSTLFDMISSECEKFGTPLVSYQSAKNPKADFTLPPMIVFFDEAHALPQKMMTGGLLNAMEPDDGMMLVKHSDSSTSLVNCQYVCWVAATTEKGKLFDAFANRLGNDIEWRSAAPKEVSKIVKQKMDIRFANGELPLAITEVACDLVSNYRRVPREAINFAIDVVQQKHMCPSDTWEDAAKVVAEDMGLDQWGFSQKQIDILTALGQRPVAENRLSGVAKCRIEQVTRYELPMLMDYSNNSPLVVPVSGKGMCITEAGLEELKKRGITYSSRNITAEYFESKR